MAKNEEISLRLREFMKDHYPSVNEFSAALGMSQPSVSSYLNGTHTPGNKVQERLRSLGCDIEWLMTGKLKGEQKQKKETLISYSGTPSPEVKKRIQRLAEWMSNANEEDTKMLEQIARKILKGDG
jgi:transcriptional regulator with XRE-family HTH domain